MNNLIKIERMPRKSGGPRITLVLKCSEEMCTTEIRVRKSEFKNSSLKCKIHSHAKPPFYSIYNSFKKDHRKLKNDITYGDFLELTKIQECHYCYSKIPWVKYSVVSGKYLSRAYYLDRKNNLKGYSLDNVVVCCTRCNIARSNKFSYEEWYGMTEFFRKKKDVLR